MNKKKFSNLLVLCISFALCFALAEYVFRKIIFSKNDAFKSLHDPSKYANPLSQDYWMVNHYFEKTYLPPTNPHPLLGWVGFFNRENYDHNDLSKADNKRKVLIYGDSFIMCVDTVRCFEEILNNDPDFAKNSYLLNYGVGGYGVDQIYMLCSLTVKKYENPFVIFSIMPADMDRSILHFRIGQKPYYEIENGNLELKNIPIEPNTEQYLEKNPVSFNSYLYRRFKYSPLNVFHNQKKEDEPLHQQIISLNSKIILDADKFLKQSGVQYVFMLFDNMYNTDGEWRMDFLKKFLLENSIPYFVSSDLVKTDKTFSTYIFSNYIIDGNGHPTTHYNNLVCNEIKKRMGIEISDIFIQNTNATSYSANNNVEYWINKIKNDSEWLKHIKEKSIQRKIPLDSMILLDAQWMMQQQNSK